MLSRFTFERWDAILLAALPALLNICIFAYMRLRIPDNKTSRMFALFVLGLTLWQVSDTFVRMSSNIDDARFWNNLLTPGVLFTTSLGLHFALLFTGRKKYAESFTVQLLIYLPSTMLLVYGMMRNNDYPFVPSEFWGWTFTTKADTVWAIEGYWLSVQALIMLFVLFRRAFTLPKSTPLRRQALIIAFGFLVPVLQGIATEVILPELDGNSSIPVTSTFFTFFSVATLVALSRYRMFNVTESLKIPTILNALTDMLIVLAPDGTIRFMNKTGAKTLGLSSAQSVGMKIGELFVREQEAENFLAKMQHQNGKKVAKFATELVTRDGQRLTVLISATTFKTSVQEAQVLLLIQDISGQVQTEQQLAERESQLKEKSGELQNFFYRVTHDLKGPSASIIGLVRLAKKENFPPLALDYISKVEDSAVRLESILLDFIRVIHIQERQLVTASVDLPQLVNEIIQPMQYDTSITLPDMRVSIKCRNEFYSDRGLVSSILYNLVTNAVKYRKKQADQESYVSISIEEHDNGIIARVSDNGIGIPPNIRDDVFNIFFRGAENAKGTGLGLYIVKNAVSKLGGRIELESEVNKGTTFTIILPNLAGQVKKHEPLALIA